MCDVRATSILYVPVLRCMDTAPNRIDRPLCVRVSIARGEWKQAPHCGCHCGDVKQFIWPCGGYTLPDDLVPSCSKLPKSVSDCFSLIESDCVLLLNFPKFPVKLFYCSWQPVVGSKEVFPPQDYNYRGREPSLRCLHAPHDSSSRELDQQARGPSSNLHWTIQC